jgi:GAF domain-containing protein
METALQTGQIAFDEENGTRLAIPLRIGGQVIGVVDGRKSDGSGRWTEEEVELLGSLAEQLDVALEGARLYRDTQRRAARDRLIGDITARVRETLDVDTVLQTAIQEIGDALNIAEVEVRMGTSTQQQPPAPPAHIGDDGSEITDDNAPSPPGEVPS